MYSVCQDGACLCKSPTDGNGEKPAPTCLAPEECSLPDCTGEGKTVACEEGTCTCKTDTALACLAPEECSLPDCIGEGKIVSCEKGLCTCKTAGNEDDNSLTCSAPEECSLPDCTGEGKTVTCEDGTCTCKTTDTSEGPTKVPPTPTFVPTQIVQEDGATVSVIIIHGGPITSPITITSAPEPTIDVAGDEFHSSVSSISSRVVIDILPQASAWADAPDPAKATEAVQSIEGLIPIIGEIAGGLPDGQRIFDCPQLSAPVKRQDANDLVLQLQKTNCKLLEILGALEQGQTSSDPAVVGPAQQQVHGDGTEIVADLEGLDGILGDGDDSSSQTCTAVEECKLPNCTGDGKTVACEEGKCTCTDQDDNVPDTCSADADCASLSDCEGDGKTKVCEDGDCICKTEDEDVVTTTMTALPPGASLQTITDQITANTVTTTTSEGSSDPTIVPIIVVLGKPPVICWGCVPLPAKIQIKVPEFCVNILGFKIGNCPSNDNEDNNQEDNNQEEDDDEEEEECDVLTVTCTQPCFVHEANPQSTITCQTASESIPCQTPKPAECTPTSTTTTTTTEATPAITGSCSSESCGGGSCDISKRGAVSQSQKREPLAKRAHPPPFDSPILVDNFADFDNRDEQGKASWFMYARQLIDQFSARNGEDEDGNAPTSRMWDLDGLDRPFITGAGPSWGCTTIMVYSKLGIYLAHLWEEEDIGDPDGFEAAKEFIREGMPNGNPDLYQPSLLEAAQRYFPGDSWVKAVVFTPKTDSIRIRRDGSVMETPGGGRSLTNPWYKVQVDDLMSLILEYVPHATVAPLPYNLISNQQGLAGELGQQENTLAVLQYLPGRSLQGDGGCEAFRSIRIIHPLRQVWGPTTWRQGPLVLNQNNKRADASCPASAAAPAADEEIYDENGEPLDPSAIGNGDGDSNSTTPDPKTCATAEDCSSPNCSGGGVSSFCEGGVCVCKTPTPPPPRTKCSSDNECSSPNCSGAMVVSKCEEGFCVCNSPDDPSACSTADTCTYLECEDSEERACNDGKCECQAKTCSDADACGFLSCDDDKEKACESSKCVCKTKAPPYASGTCNTHIREYGGKDGFSTSIVVYDGAGTEIARYGEVNTKHNVSAALIEQRPLSLDTD
jgi:hypothetical protein